ncbi:hypothetical protein GCM10027019_12900 [Melaminivora jejuensis]
MADSLAAQRFAAIMAQPVAAPVAPAPAALAPAIAPASAAAASSIGERILSGMGGISGDMQASWKAVAEVLQRGEHQVNLQDMLRLQMNLVQVTMQYDLVGKVVSRSGQNIDHLVRLQ